MLPITQPLGRETRQLIQEIWTEASLDAARISLRLESLTQALRVHGTTQSVLQMALRAIEDLKKEATASGKLAAEFGRNKPLEPPSRPGPLAPVTLSIDQKVLYEAVYIGCVYAPIYGSIAGTIYEHSRWPSIKLAAHLVFESRVWQGRLGWAHLSAAIEQVETAWLEPFIQPMLEHAISSTYAVYRPQDTATLGHGVLDKATFAGVVRNVVNTTILPGFESLDYQIDEARLWMRELK